MVLTSCISQEIHGLLRQGVSVDTISSQLSPWASALFEFLPPFIRKQVCYPKYLQIWGSFFPFGHWYQCLTNMFDVTAPPFPRIRWFCSVIPGTLGLGSFWYYCFEYVFVFWLFPFFFVFQIETEKLLAHLVEAEMNKRVVKYNQSLTWLLFDSDKLKFHFSLVDIWILHNIS